MSPRPSYPIRRERGIALVTSLLLLLIITILALSMFKGFGSQERIAGNMREKERALHAAESAQQYAEWWLTQGNNAAIGAVTCTAVLNGNATGNPGQICNQTLQAAVGLTPLNPLPPVTSVPMPWAVSVTYLPAGMSVSGPSASGDPPYFAAPGFFVADLGPASDNAGEAYQIDAYGYGGSATTVAIVESSYEIAQGVVCLTCG